MCLWRVSDKDVTVLFNTCTLCLSIAERMLCGRLNYRFREQNEATAQQYRFQMRASQLSVSFVSVLSL